MATFEEPESFAEKNDSSTEDASDNFYLEPVAKTKAWDTPLTTKGVLVSASDLHTGFIRKGEVFLKIITILITFCVTLTTGVASKGALLFMIAQVREHPPIVRF